MILLLEMVLYVLIPFVSVSSKIEMTELEFE